MVDDRAEIRRLVDRVNALTKENEDLKREIAMREEMARLKAENEKLRGAVRGTRGKLSLKVSPKGAASLYGLGKYPTTLYKQQWDRLLAFTEEIRTFLARNAGKLKVKE